MTNCITVRATKYRMFVMVHQCLRNTLTNHRKELYRELSTCINPEISILPRFKCHPFKYNSQDKYWRGCCVAINSPSIFNTRCTYFSDDKSKVGNDAEPKGEPEKLSLVMKFKRLYKEYWYVLVPVHLITSILWFGSCYYIAASGFDIPGWLESLGAPDSWVEKVKNSKAGHAVAAYTLYKLATPIRYTVSLGGTTIAINYLKSWGWIKPVPNKAAIKRIYREQKGAFKDLTSTYQDKFQMRKDGLIKKKHEIKEQYVEARDGIQKSVIETKKDFKKGVEGFSVEMKNLGASCKKSINKIIKKESDYTAKTVVEKNNKKK